MEDKANPGKDSYQKTENLSEDLKHNRNSFDI